MTAIEDKTSTLRRCCDLIRAHRSLGIVALASLTDSREACVRKAVARGIELGYLTEGPKPQRLGKGNRLKTYVRTRKRFPREEKVIKRAPIVDWTALAQRRDWAVVALFGPYEARGAS